LVLHNLIHDNDNLAVQQLVDLVYVAGELLEFLFDLPLDELNLATIDLALVDVGGQLSELLGKGDDLSTIELDLAQLMLRAVVEQLLPSVSVRHNKYLMARSRNILDQATKSI
jgi:hypothetical protein